MLTILQDIIKIYTTEKEKSTFPESVVVESEIFPVGYWA
jgi:hypothetical protein